MSEFSDSYHFLGSVSELRVAASRTEDTPVVVAAGERWTSFLLGGVTADPPPPEVRGTVVRWTFAEDHGWTFSIYVDGVSHFDFAQSWDAQPYAFEMAGRLADAAVALDRPESELEPFFAEAAMDGDDGRGRARGLASLLGWPAMDRVAHRHLPTAPLLCTRCRTRYLATDAATRCPGCSAASSEALAEPIRARTAGTTAVQERFARRVRTAHHAGLLRLASLDGAAAVAIAIEDELAGGSPPFDGLPMSQWLLSCPEIERVDATERELGAHLLM